MERFRLSTDERALSPVIGTVLMVGITVTLMAMVGAVVLQGTPAEANSEMEVVHDTDVGQDSTNITVGVASGEGELEFLHDNIDACERDGETDVEKGDRITFTCENDLLEEDSITVIDDGPHSEVIGELDPGAGGGGGGDQPENGVFELELLDAEDEVVEGEEATYTVSVTNTGDEYAEEDLELEVSNMNGGSTEVSEEIALDSGEDDDVELVWEPPVPDSDVHVISIHSDHPSNSINEVGPLSVVPADSDLEFEELTVEVTEITEFEGGGGGSPHDPLPSTFEIDYEIDQVSDPKVEFDVSLDDESDSTTKINSQGTVTSDLEVFPQNDDGPATIEVTVDDTLSCETDVSASDEGDIIDFSNCGV